MKFDLEERTSLFGERLIGFLKQLPKNNLVNPLAEQLIRSGTSIGANYFEANQAGTKKDFRNKIYICKKEANETKYWLRMIAKLIDENHKEECRKLWTETHELVLIFSKILSSTKPNV